MINQYFILVMGSEQKKKLLEAYNFWKKIFVILMVGFDFLFLLWEDNK